MHSHTDSSVMWRHKKKQPHCHPLCVLSIYFFLHLLFCLFYPLPASMVSPDKGRRTTLTPSGPSSGTALLGPSLLDCNSHDSFQSRGLPDVAEVSRFLCCVQYNYFYLHLVDSALFDHYVLGLCQHGKLAVCMCQIIRWHTTVTQHLKDGYEWDESSCTEFVEKYSIKVF